MCGITGYIGPKDALKESFENLKKLEYRGYDSAGVVFFEKDKLRLIKTVGKLVNLESKISGLESKSGTAAISHTRWATHGEPNIANAHPHSDCRKQIFLVHNGIIENYRDLKAQLVKSGHEFKSQTDTEIVAHLIEEKLKKESDFFKAFRSALKDIRGAYALSVINSAEPEKIYIARLGSPMVIGVGGGEYYIASDPTALAGLAKE